MMRMDGADDAILREEVAAVLRARAQRTAVLYDDAFDVDVREHFATAIADARDESVGELAAAADRHADAIGFEECDEHESADARGLLIGRHEVLAGDTREMHAHLVVLEVVAQHVVTAHLHDAPDLTTFAALIHHRGGCAL